MVELVDRVVFLELLDKIYFVLDGGEVDDVGDGGGF